MAESDLFTAAVSRFERNGFAGNIEIRYYGQHTSVPKGYPAKAAAGACVEGEGEIAAKALEKLIGIKTFKTTKVRFRKETGLSIKAIPYIERVNKIKAAKRASLKLKPSKRTLRRR